MKIMKKIVSMLLTLSMLITFGNVAFATGMSTVTDTAGTGTASSAMPKPVMDGTNPFSDMGSKVLGYIQWFGYVIAVGMLLYIGIKYMMSSANEKADLKKGSVNYVIVAVLVATAATVVGFFQSAGKDIAGSN